MNNRIHWDQSAQLLELWNFPAETHLSPALPHVNAVRNLQELHPANFADSNPSPQTGSAELFNIHVLFQAMENIHPKKK